MFRTWFILRFKIIRLCVGLHLYSSMKKFFTNHYFGTLEIVKVEVKVKFTLERATKAQRVSRGISLTSALDGYGWSRPRPGRFTPGKDPVPTL